MNVYPGIHIRNGQCFNPAWEPHGTGHMITKNPVAMARLWASKGAKWLHVVDVDSARAGAPMNQDLIKSIVDAVDIPVQYGGGLRNIRDIETFLHMGVQRVIISTKAIQNQRFVEEVIHLFGADKIIVAIDTQDGMVMMEGRGKVSTFNMLTLAMNMKQAGVKKLLYTDITKVQTSQGPNIVNAKELLSKTDMQVIMAGAITSLKDIEALSALPIDGVMVGKVLYEELLDLSELLEHFERGTDH